MEFLVPYDRRDPKTRLEPVFDHTERAAFAAAMLEDVLLAFDSSRHDPRILSTAPIDGEKAVLERTPVTIDERPLTDAVNAEIEEAEEPIGVLMADLPLIRPETIDELASTSGDVVIGPGLGGGTNALVVRDRSFRVDYHGASVLDHRSRAKTIGVTVSEFDSRRLATDIDDPEDLIEVLLHGEGKTANWLTEAGFRLDIDDAYRRVTFVRD